MCTGWLKIDPGVPFAVGPLAVVRFSWLVRRLGWFGSGGRMVLFSNSMGIRGGGGLYAGYLEVISCRNRW